MDPMIALLFKACIVIYGIVITMSPLIVWYCCAVTLWGLKPNRESTDAEIK